MSQPAQLDRRRLQILVAALIAGVVTFAAVAIVVAPVGNAANLMPIRVAGFAMMGASIVAALFMRRAMLAGSTPAGNPYATHDPGDHEEDAELVRRYVTATIVGCALLEGAALFGAVIYLISADPMSLLIVGLPLLTMAIAFFPTDGRWRRFTTAHEGG